jgi:hypothetical protein
MKKRVFTLTCLAVTTVTLVANASAQKMKAEDVIAKHLESIGKAEDRTAIKNLVATGVVRWPVGRATQATERSS